MEIRGHDGIADPFRDGGPRNHRGLLRRSGTGSLSEVLVAEVPLRVLEFRSLLPLSSPGSSATPSLIYTKEHSNSYKKPWRQNDRPI